jgi:hypothetical protein
MLSDAKQKSLKISHLNPKFVDVNYTFFIIVVTFNYWFLSSSQDYLYRNIPHLYAKYFVNYTVKCSHPSLFPQTKPIFSPHFPLQR